MKSLLLPLLMCLWAASGSLPAETIIPGHHRQLTDGPLFIPSGFEPDARGQFDLTLHLHGAPAVVETNFIAARSPGVLANVTLPGLSAVYAERFKDTNTFWRILRETEALLATPNAPAPQLRRLTVTSFSAGFGGVRELLKDSNIVARIDALVMADSIYAGFAGSPAGRKVNPLHMEDFLQFAHAAAEGRKRLLISHSQLHTPTYASTAETADYLIAQLGGRRVDAPADWPGGLKLLSRFQLGQCEILGFAGDTAESHLLHLRHLRLWFERLRH